MELKFNILTTQQAPVNVNVEGRLQTEIRNHGGNP